MFIKEAVSHIATYSADTFGVCSALFELGGMIVIHDPSGCNSTYTTHDEPRWYDRDSLIFISGLTEMDALMGDDAKFIHDVVEGARQFSPRFIVLLCTPVPFMIGTDFPALAQEIEAATGIPTFAGQTNSMETYEKGISWALQLVAGHMVKSNAASTDSRFCCSWQPVFASQHKKAIPVNVIGMTPLDFSYLNSENTIRRLLAKEGFSVRSVWAMGSRIEEIEMAGQAAVNLVVSYGGLEAAKIMKKRFDQPYVIGIPIGPFRDVVCQALYTAVQTGENQYPCLQRKSSPQASAAIVGESVYAASLAAAIELAMGLPIQILCPLEPAEKTLQNNDCCMFSERELQTCLTQKRIIIADPLYQPICPDQAQFIPLGHGAFSGRMYEKQIPDLMKAEVFFDFATQIKGGETYGVK